MDFEFSMINKTSMVLISGAISNSLDRFKIRKLEGRPLLLPVNEEVRPIKDREVVLAKKEIKRIFRCKEVLRDACLDQFEKSLRSTLNNLDNIYIENYIQQGGKTNVIVLWNGNSDKRVLQKLNINKYPILNITCYDKNFNQNFSIQLEKLNTKEIIFEIEIGIFQKTGRLLNLEETHNIICSKNHKLTHTHDPRTDVKLTKCIFDYIVRKQGYENLIKHF